MYVSRRASKVDLRGGASIYIYIPKDYPMFGQPVRRDADAME